MARLLAFAMTQPESVARDSRPLWLGYGAMCVGMFMAILDIQVVATSLTNIAAAAKTGLLTLNARGSLIMRMLKRAIGLGH